MKRMFALFLALAMLIAFSSCGNAEETAEVETEEPAKTDAEALENTLADSLLGFGLQKIVDALGTETVSVGIEDHDSVEGLALVYIEVSLEGDAAGSSLTSSEAVVRMAYSIVADSNRLITEEDAKVYAESLGRNFDNFVELKISDVRDMYLSPEVQVISGELSEGELDLLESVMDQITNSYKEQKNNNSVRKADFTTTDLYGETVNSLDLFSEAEMTILCIWTSWSIPSAKELVVLQTLQDELEENGVQVVLLLWDASTAEASTAVTARQTMEENNIELPCLLFTTGLSTTFNKSGYPASFLVSSDGTVLTGELWGMFTAEEYITWIEEQTGIELSLS